MREKFIFLQAAPSQSWKLSKFFQTLASPEQNNDNPLLQSHESDVDPHKNSQVMLQGKTISID
jgi:hypothetical protein